MNAMQVHSRGEQIGVVSEAHGSQVAAIRSAPQRNFLRIDIRQCLEIMSRGNDVFVLCSAARTSVGWFAKMPAIHDAGSIIYREHDISTVGQVLIHGISIVV